MNFYEKTIIAKQDLPEKDVNMIKNKYNDLINNSLGKVVKFENWGLLNLSRRIKKNSRGFFLHYKFEGNKKTVDEINKQIRVDNTIIRHLIVKYKKLDLEKEYFKKNN
jgi:small subunit ribosomal protein S6